MNFAQFRINKEVVTNIVKIVHVKICFLGNVMKFYMRFKNKILDYNILRKKYVDEGEKCLEKCNRIFI